MPRRAKLVDAASMPRKVLSDDKENVQQNAPPPKPARKPKPTPKGNAPDNYLRLEVGTQNGKVELTRAEGAEGQPQWYRQAMCIAFKGCECRKRMLIPVHNLDNSKALSRFLSGHKTTDDHKDGMALQVSAFAESLARPEEQMDLIAPVDRDPVERRRANVNRGRAAPLRSQANFSELVDTPSTFGGSALPTTDAGLSFIGGGVAGETPAALQQALPTTRSNYTFQLPDSNLTDAARYADLDKIPGGVLLAQVASGASAVVYAFKWRDPNDRGYVIDAQIDSASDLRKGPLLLLRKEASMQVAKESYQNEAEPLRIAKVFNDNEDGVGEFADEEAAYDAILARRVEPEFIMGCSGSGMTHQGEVHLALTPTRT